MPIGVPTVLGAPIRQHATERNPVLFKEGQHAIIQQIRRRNRRLLGIQLREPDLRIRVDEGLLVDAPHAFQRADVKRILCPTVAWTLALELAVRFLVELDAFQGGELRFGENATLLRDLRF